LNTIATIPNGMTRAAPPLNTPPSRRYYFVLMAPAILVLMAISLYPFFWLINMSLHQIADSPNDVDRWVGLANYFHLFRDTSYISGWGKLVQYSSACMTVEVVSGVLIALILNLSRFEKALVTVFLMPMMVAPVVAGLLWLYLLNSTFGWYHWLLQSLGVLGARSMLGSPESAMVSIVLVDAWQWTPLIILIVLAGLKRVPQDQLEANMVDGAGPLRNFVSITLPNLYPFLLIAILLRFMDNFRFIDAILVLTGGGPADATKILPIRLFEVSFTAFDLGYGGAIALTLLVVTIIVGMILVRSFTVVKTSP
jgi:multiple sugar transport system permease protein